MVWEALIYDRLCLASPKSDHRSRGREAFFFLSLFFLNQFLFLFFQANRIYHRKAPSLDRGRSGTSRSRRCILFHLSEYVSRLSRGRRDCVCYGFTRPTRRRSWGRAPRRDMRTRILPKRVEYYCRCHIHQFQSLNACANRTKSVS